ncbi:MAG: hypothetical protein AB1486_18895 [Planctomycetota bacterium]
MAKLFSWSLCCLAGALLMGLLTACSDKEPAKAQGESKAPAETVANVEVTPELAAKLGAADAFDGATDKVVSKCPGCALGMDGVAANSVKVGDYALHFCSAECAASFQKDAKTHLAALEVPKK